MALAVRLFDPNFAMEEADDGIDETNNVTSSSAVAQVSASATNNLVGSSNAPIPSSSQAPVQPPAFQTHIVELCNMNEILDAMRCSFCGKIPHPENSCVCEVGHVICFRPCYHKVPSCPKEAKKAGKMCEKRIFSNRSQLYNCLYFKSYHKCPFPDCRTLPLGENVRSHIRSCIANPKLSCPFTTCSQKGFHYLNYIDHLQSAHSVLTFSSTVSSVNFVMDVPMDENMNTSFGEQRHRWVNCLLKSKNSGTFMVIGEEYNGGISMWICLAPNENYYHRFSTLEYNLNVVPSPQGGRKALSWAGQVQSFDNFCADDSVSGGAFTISKSVMSNYYMFGTGTLGLYWVINFEIDENEDESAAAPQEQEIKLEETENDNKGGIDVAEQEPQIMNKETKDKIKDNIAADLQELQISEEERNDDYTGDSSLAQEKVQIKQGERKDESMGDIAQEEQIKQEETKDENEDDIAEAQEEVQIKQEETDENDDIAEVQEEVQIKQEETKDEAEGNIAVVLQEQQIMKKETKVEIESDIAAVQHELQIVKKETKVEIESDIAAVQLELQIMKEEIKDREERNSTVLQELQIKQVETKVEIEGDIAVDLQELEIKTEETKDKNDSNFVDESITQQIEAKIDDEPEIPGTSTRAVAVVVEETKDETQISGVSCVPVPDQEGEKVEPQTSTSTDATPAPAPGPLAMKRRRLIRKRPVQILEACFTGKPADEVPNAGEPEGDFK